MSERERERESEREDSAQARTGAHRSARVCRCEGVYRCVGV